QQRHRACPGSARSRWGRPGLTHAPSMRNTRRLRGYSVSSMGKCRVRACAAIVILSAWGSADASRFGRDGFSGNPGSNGGSTCTACHAPGAATPTVTISGPQVLDAGTIADYTVTISGGPGVTGGLGVS